MNRAAELFSDEAMGYGAEAPQLGGYSGSLIGERVTDSLLPGGGVLPAGQKEEMLRLMSGGARGRKTQKGGGQQTQPRRHDLSPLSKMKLPQSNMFDDYNANKLDITGKPSIGDPQKGFTTPEKGLGPFGNLGYKPGEQKPENAPGAPVKKILDFSAQGGGARRASRKAKKVQRGGRRRTTKQGRKSFLNIRVTGQIRLKQRHRQ